MSTVVIISSAIVSVFALETSILTAQQMDSRLHNLTSNWETQVAIDQQITVRLEALEAYGGHWPYYLEAWKLS